MSDTFLDQRHQCSGCGEHLIIVFEPDGDHLCVDCANNWVKGEGDYQAYLELCENAE